MSGIVIEKVRKSFDTKDGVVEALKDVNLNIDSGDIYGIIGQKNLIPWSMIIGRFMNIKCTGTMMKILWFQNTMKLLDS